MNEKKKKGLFSRIFGGNSGCCSIQLEEVDEPDKAGSNPKGDTVQTGCCRSDRGSEKDHADDSGAHDR